LPTTIGQRAHSGKPAPGRPPDARDPIKDQLNEGNLTQALQNAASLQVLKGIRPIIFDYDQTTRVLNVVDRSFLIWLAYQDRAELLAELGIEDD
jgi:hypothetical protein